MKRKHIKIGAFSALLLAAGLRAAAAGPTVVIVGEGAAVESLSPDALKAIYTGKTTYWPNGQSVVIALLAEKTDDAVKDISGMDPSQFRTFWQRMVFSGRGQQPKKVADAPALLALVASTKGAIAVVPAGAVPKGVKILAVN